LFMVSSLFVLMVELHFHHMAHHDAGLEEGGDHYIDRLLGACPRIEVNQQPIAFLPKNGVEYHLILAQGNDK